MDFNANPESMRIVEKLARSDNEVINVFTHKINENEYYKNILNKEAWNRMEVSQPDEEKLENIEIKFKADYIYSSKLNQEIDFDKIFKEEMKNKI
jgi:hypothetical protein